MKIEMTPQLNPQRGGKVEVGNVYTNPHGKNFYKIVMGVKNEKYNNVVFLHVDTTGQICGASCQPETYVSEHQDLVGKVSNMPTLKITWLKRR